MAQALAFDLLFRLVEHLRGQIDAGDLAVMRIGFNGEAGADADLEDLGALRERKGVDDVMDSIGENVGEEPVVEVRQFRIHLAFVRLGAVECGHGNPFLSGK